MAKLTLPFAARGDVTLSGDLYLPAGAGPHPVLVGVPGGGWLRNRKEQLVHWGEHLAANGYALFAIDYRRSDQGPIWPSNLEDVWSAIDYIKAKGGEHGLDVAQLGMFGASAGAHLSAMAALTGEDRGIEVMVLAYGVYDLFDHWDADRWRYTGPGSDLTERMLGKAPYDDPDLYFAASPRLHVTRARASRMKVMLVWGEADEMVLPRQTKAFGRALEQAGAVVRPEPVADAGHLWFSSDPIDEPTGYTAGVAPRIVRFLKLFLP